MAGLRVVVTCSLAAGLVATLAGLFSARLYGKPQRFPGGEGAVFESAVLDRVVDDTHAVLLVGESAVERVVARTLLPADVTEGTWLLVRFEGERLAEVRVDAQRTERARKRIEEKMQRLRARGRG